MPDDFSEPARGTQCASPSSTAEMPRYLNRWRLMAIDLALATLLLLLIPLIARAQNALPDPGATETQEAEARPSPPLAGQVQPLSPHEDLQRAAHDLAASGRRLDTVTSVLGGLSLILVVLSFILAVAGYFGWRSLQSLLQGRVQEEARKWESKFDETNKAIEQTKNELEARLKNAMALMFGRLSRVEGDFLSVGRRDFLEKAIDLANQAYQDFDRLSVPDSPHRWSALNNLTFYRALQGDLTFADLALVNAEELRRHCLLREKDFHFLTTYVRVVGEFCRSAENPLGVFAKAENALSTLRHHPRVAQREREEADQYSTWLSQVKRRFLEEAGS